MTCRGLVYIVMVKYGAPSPSGHIWAGTVTQSPIWSHMVRYGHPKSIWSHVVRYGHPKSIWLHIVRYGHPKSVWSNMVRYGHPKSVWSHMVEYSLEVEVGTAQLNLPHGKDR